MSLYTALPAMATIYGREVLGTYHERMGALPWPEDFAAGAAERASGRG